MAGEGFIQIQPLEADPSLIKPDAPRTATPAGTGKICGLDVGSTTCKYLTTASGELLGQAYERHNTKPAEKILDFLTRSRRKITASLRSGTASSSLGLGPGSWPP